MGIESIRSSVVEATAILKRAPYEGWQMTLDTLNPVADISRASTLQQQLTYKRDLYLPTLQTYAESVQTHGKEVEQVCEPMLNSVGSIILKASEAVQEAPDMDECLAQALHHLAAFQDVMGRYLTLHTAAQSNKDASKAAQGQTLTELEAHAATLKKL